VLLQSSAKTKTRSTQKEEIELNSTVRGIGVKPEIATRKFLAAEELLSKMPGNAYDPDLLFPYLQKLRNSVETYFFLGKQDPLMLATSQFRSIIDRLRAPDGSIQFSNTFLELALLEAVEGDADEATRLVRQWR